MVLEAGKFYLQVGPTRTLPRGATLLLVSNWNCSKAGNWAPKVHSGSFPLEVQMMRGDGQKRIGLRSLHKFCEFTCMDGSTGCDSHLQIALIVQFISQNKATWMSVGPLDLAALRLPAPDMFGTPISLSKVKYENHGRAG